MASLPSFVTGSASTASSFHDAIASYRRSQYLVAGSAVSASDESDFIDGEDDGLSVTEEVDEDLETSVAGTPNGAHDDHDFVSQLEWDTLDTTEGHLPHQHPSHVLRQTPSTPFLPSSRRALTHPATSPPSRLTEGTPLLQKVSFGSTPYPARVPVFFSCAQPLSPPLQAHETSYFPDVTSRRPVLRPVIRRASTSSIAKSVKQSYGGQSTFGQTLFNCTAILLGIGMLSEPLAFSYAGWVTGTMLIIFYGFISCYTAKILARIILSDPRLRSYADIGRKAFGPKSTLLISLIFCLELFAVSVVLVTLYADSLHSVIPTYSANTYKVWGLLLLIPTVFLPLSLLSYTSILGVVSTVLMIAVVLIDGLSKKDAPGSLWSPAKTSFGIDNWNHLGIAFGLYMAGFSGHAVIPSLARDMVDPGQFDRMINWAFVVATSVYALIGYAGYLMFGNSVSDEISRDLLRTPGYSAVLNQAALWMLVISPLSKFALTTQPLNATIEIVLGLNTPLATPEDVAARLSKPISPGYFSFKRMLGVFQRISVTILSVATSIIVPEFSSLMAFLGSFSAFMIVCIGPISAKIAINRHCGVFDGVVLAISIIMATWGTIAAFMSA